MRTSTANHPAESFDGKRILFVTAWICVFLIALYLRGSGLFRGLDTEGGIFHPDEPKQVIALVNFLKGIYLRYYGDIFYDGYPYGLNHLDEYLLRPLFFLFNADIPDRIYFYYYARLLRVAYGMLTVVLLYKFVHRVLQDRTSALLAMFLFAIAPLPVAVTHFATGDIGVDLFTALCFLFLLPYTERDHKMNKLWLFAGGAAVGAAFSAKYNGLLVGMVPGTLVCLQAWHTGSIRFFVSGSIVLLTGTVAGVILLTPNLALDFGTTLDNMAANFHFIKNYHVPADILARPWLEKALLGLRKNSLPIISALGCYASLAVIIGLPVIGRQSLSCLKPGMNRDCSRKFLILSVALFPPLAFFVSLTGKYVVQPFHFSYLQFAVIAVAGVLFHSLVGSGRRFLQVCGILMIVLIAIEFGRVSLRENFFWRHEDNVHYQQKLPGSIFIAKSLHPGMTGKIRSLFLEPQNSSVFRNRANMTNGPDPDLWNAIEVAPLPQIPNPIGRDWVFLNGPTFPRNEKVIYMHARNRGKTVKKYVVLPAGSDWPALGFRCGSYPTEALIDFGGTKTAIRMEAHQQKTLLLEPEEWMISGNRRSDGEEVYIVPFEISVPHNDLWLTFLATQKERKLFHLFGGGQDEEPVVPEKMGAGTEKRLVDALRRVRYMETETQWHVTAGERRPVWEVVLPAGRYRLVSEVEGLADKSELTIELEDARGGLHLIRRQSFTVRKGKQRIEYDFSKPFVPYQGRLVISGVTGACNILHFSLFPDYSALAADFEAWRSNGIKPEWVSRFDTRLTP